MTNNPEEIRRDIERTRQELSDDVNALHEKVSPARVVGRRVEHAKGAMTGVKERVMGSTSSTDGKGGALSSAGDKMSTMAGSVADTASGAPSAARRQTQGNPLAAGLVAFGAGWLLSSILPATAKEEELAGRGKDLVMEHADPVKAQLGQAATEMKENLREPAEQAATSVKDKASDAASAVQVEARAVKDNTRSPGGAP